MSRQISTTSPFAAVFAMVVAGSGLAQAQARMAKLLAFLALLTAAVAAPSAAQSGARAADETAIRAVIQAFLDTREKNDAAGLAALLTPDVDQRQTSGSVRSGRDAVVSGSLATQQSTGGRRTITVDSLRFVGSDVAIADGRYDSVGRADGTDQRMLTSMVLRREGGAWKIAAIRNMLPSNPQP